MELIYPAASEGLQYNKLCDLVFKQDNPRQIFIFPDVEATIPTISPAKYYVTSGEAIKKTDKLIEDLKLTLKKAQEFKKILLKTKGKHLYLELTKCEDGAYSGNTVSRKDPKKKKEEIL